MQEAYTRTGSATVRDENPIEVWSSLMVNQRRSILDISTGRLSLDQYIRFGKQRGLKCEWHLSVLETKLLIYTVKTNWY